MRAWGQIAKGPVWVEALGGVKMASLDGRLINI
jgi:hypothetical protein